MRAGGTLYWLTAWIQCAEVRPERSQYAHCIQMVLQNHKEHDDRVMYKNETRLAIESEEMGFDIVWPVEHHFLTTPFVRIICNI